MTTVEKRIDLTKSVVPLMAALPYSVSTDVDDEPGFEYDPMTQRTIYAGSKASTCNDSESRGLTWSGADRRQDD